MAGVIVFPITWAVTPRCIQRIARARYETGAALAVEERPACGDCGGQQRGRRRRIYLAGHVTDLPNHPSSRKFVSVIGWMAPNLSPGSSQQPVGELAGIAAGEAHARCQDRGADRKLVSWYPVPSRQSPTEKTSDAQRRYERLQRGELPQILGSSRAITCAIWSATLHAKAESSSAFTVTSTRDELVTPIAIRQLPFGARSRFAW
jgi:hypothetical protein